MAETSPSDPSPSDSSPSDSPPSDSPLAKYRASIDNIDAAIIHLLAERFKITRKVGEYKATHDLPPADPARESQQIARLREKLRDNGSEPRVIRTVRGRGYVYERDASSED